MPGTLVGEPYHDVQHGGHPAFHVTGATPIELAALGREHDAAAGTARRLERELIEPLQQHATIIPKNANGSAGFPSRRSPLA